MSRHLRWSDVLSGHSQNRGLYSLRFTAAPRYPFQQLKSSFAFRCSLCLQQSILHTCSRDQPGALHCTEPFQPPVWNPLRVISHYSPLRLRAFTQRHRQRLFPGRRKAAHFLCLKLTLPPSTSRANFAVSSNKGFRRNYRAYILDPSCVGRLHPGSSRIIGLAWTR
jgi:hypothetical protein